MSGFIKLTAKVGALSCAVDFTAGLLMYEAAGGARVQRLGLPMEFVQGPDEILSILAAPAPAEIEPRLELFKEAMAHLSAALGQSVPSDDQIIIGHVRDARSLLAAALAARGKP